jgi:hypothetical protein
MLHIVKWNSQSEKISKSWKSSIEFSRKKIKDIQETHPSLNDNYLKENWDASVKKAIIEAEKEMNQPATKTELSWDEVFTMKYILPLLIIFIFVASLFLY